MDFEAIAAQLRMSEEDKAALLTVTGKYPLGTILVPKSKFDEAQSAFEAADTYVKKWEEFRNNDWDAEHGMTKAQYAAEQELATLRGEVTTLKSGTYVPPGDNMGFDEVEQFLKTKGYATMADLNGFAKKDELTTTVDAKVNQHGLNQEFFFTRSAMIPQMYVKEFGDADFDMDAFMRFVIAGGDRYLKGSDGQPVKRFDAAYDSFVADKRFKVKEAQQAAKDQELAAREQAINTRQTEAASPTDDGRGGTIPPFQRRIQGLDKSEDAIGGDAPFGSGVLSAQIAEKYRRGELPLPGKAN